MASLHGFNSWDEIANYIENTLGIHYTDNPTSWNEAMKEEMEGYKFIKIINDATGVVTEEIVSESLYQGVGEIHVNENYQGQTISGGGAKSAPTAKSVITNNSTKTAVVTEEATGVKDTGVSAFTSPINILSGLMQVYGLIHAGIEVANAQVWKDMSNYVYGTDFTEDTPLERVIDFMGKKITNTVTDWWEAAVGDHSLRINIPETIAKRMYAFMASHMIQSQTPGIFPVISDDIEIYYTFTQRTFEFSSPLATLERYMSVTNPTTSYALSFVDISDDFFKVCVEDALLQMVGSGFLLSEAVITALLASMNGVYDYLKTQSVDAVDNDEFCSVIVSLTRSGGVSKDTPVSMSEIYITINCYHDTNIVIHDAETDDPWVAVDFNVNPNSGGVAAPTLAPGYSYQNGDNVRYLKRSGTGEEPSDYAYVFRIKDTESHTGSVYHSVIISYPANEQTFYYSATAGQSPYTVALPVNGYCNSDINTTGIPATGMTISNTNIGYKGYGSSYMPDDYLVTAGIRSKSDSAGNPEKHPDPTKTMEEQYPEMDQKTQNARPQAQTDPETGDPVVNNYITNYVPASVPSGSDNANRLIYHGLNNPDDPESYIDNRPQRDKAEGRVNTNDPVDGWNEDVDDAVKKYDETRNDPNHYPEPIPANEPNPQYPTNPPSTPEGETDDPTDPSVLPGIEASGMVSVYNPTKTEVINFSSWLWTGNVFENIKKLLQDPMEAIIGMHIMYATPHTTTPSNIIVGWLDSGVSAKVVDQQYTQLDCGDVFVPEYYGDVLDYEPYVHIHLYLPFVGIVSLKPNDVIGKQVNVTYGIDALTGTCLAMVTTTKGGSKIQCYTFPGNCAVQIPLTGGSYASVIRGISSMAVGVAGSVATGNALGAIGGVIGGVMSSHLDVSHSGTLGANAGAMGVKKPYFIITRKVAYDAAGYNQFYGYPANKTVVLGTCKGYTRVKSVHIESIPIATSDEKQQIETLLKQGVIIR